MARSNGTGRTARVARRTAADLSARELAVMRADALPDQVSAVYEELSFGGASVATGELLLTGPKRVTTFPSFAIDVLQDGGVAAGVFDLQLIAVRRDRYQRDNLDTIPATDPIWQVRYRSTFAADEWRRISRSDIGLSDGLILPPETALYARASEGANSYLVAISFTANSYYVGGRYDVA